MQTFTWILKWALQPLLTYVVTPSIVSLASLKLASVHLLKLYLCLGLGGRDAMNYVT